MTRMVLVSVLVSVLLLVASTVSAQDEIPVPPDIPPGDDVILVVKPGDRVQIHGMLFDMDTAIRWTNRLRWYQDAMRHRVEMFNEILEAAQESYRRETQIVEESYGREVQGCREDLREQARIFAENQEDPPWYSTFEFGFVVGGVVIAAVVALSAWALKSVAVAE